MDVCISISIWRKKRKDIEIETWLDKYSQYLSHQIEREKRRVVTGAGLFLGLKGRRAQLVVHSIRSIEEGKKRRGKRDR